MIVKIEQEILEAFVQEEGVQNVTKRILIGPEDGSSNIIMRYFKVLPGGNTPFHSHDFEHVVRVEKGKGFVVNASEQEIPIATGHSVFIAAGEKHQFKNPNEEPFEFLCTILNPDAI
ncbi:MAG: cupin domain-containing protein [Candidatus Aminicenantes bacterium]|nr:MAG: cupin domain-containing protein [Candidatus Aminicenantes bacterium]